MKRLNSAGSVSATKAVGYARVSTPEQAEKDLSLPAQMAAIRKYAQDHGLELVGEFVERGIAATDDNRPEFRRMLQEIYRSSSQVGSIIVTHGSRFMRNATKRAFTRRRCVSAGFGSLRSSKRCRMTRTVASRRACSS